MRKIKEILRLRFESKLSMEQIGLSCRMSSSTVCETLARCRRTGLSWPLPDGLEDPALEKLLYKDDQAFTAPADSHEPDWEAVHRELRKRKNVTLALVWEEYKEDHPDGYSYSWFCESYGRFRGRVEPVMRQTHRFGEKCFVDYAGETFSVIDPVTGEVREAQVFVGVLGGSNYTYVEATWSQQLPDWLGSHVRMFEYYGGCPEIVTPDNLKSGVRKADYYEPDINPAYNELATHYGVAVIPARKYKPRDKAKAENGVLLAERWIIASLRNRTFYSLDDLNEAIGEKLHVLNTKRFQKLEGCRQSAFEQHEKPLLRPLPAERYEYAQWKKAKVNVDYHIELEAHYYSVHYQLIGEYVEARLTAFTVEVLHSGKRVVSHRRSYVKGGHTTLKEHMPPKHAKMLEWTPQRIEAWAEKTGPSARQVVAAIMASRPHPQQGFRSCFGVMRLAQKYGDERAEAACRRAIAYGAVSYQSIKSMLEKKLDRLPLPAEMLPPRPPVQHENIRGPEHYAEIVKEAL
jgi:transposase